MILILKLIKISTINNMIKITYLKIDDYYKILLKNIRK